MSNVSFGSLSPGDIFYSGDQAYRKMGFVADVAAKGVVIDNAVSVGNRRNTTHFSDTDRVDTPEKIPQPSFWRRWLISRSLRWQISGITRWASWSWRLARLWASEETNMRLASYASRLLIMGD